MNEELMTTLQTTNKDEIAEYLFERTVVDLALEAREIINKILSKQYHLVDTEKLSTLVKTLEGYTNIAEGRQDAKIPVFIADALVKFSGRFAKSQTEPMIKEMV